MRLLKTNIIKTMLSAGYIKALAKIFRISRSYVDLYGTTQKANNQQILNVLRAMLRDACQCGSHQWASPTGFSRLETDEDAEFLIQSMKAERCMARLLPVQVVRMGARVKIQFYLEESEVSEPIFWKLTLEDGEIEVGELKTQDLPEKGFRNVVGNVAGKQATIRYVKFEFILNKNLPLGYHRFELKIRNSEFGIRNYPANTPTKLTSKFGGRWGGNSAFRIPNSEFSSYNGVRIIS